ncbi:MAG: hypothetical protein C4541_03725 [Candidatus Auribacter fodinae]|jgi:tRNA 2-thiouridine synthesizing protein A|uniref:Uncharacterized protein n=1 Tax=Candidatus Auribacter fodinae TaxID=2093366 RepID=A0A3A4R3A3_9BACT|nr:MAG: hypothetical protein C4541_03725 [Candidatus Auribacter fodinae]
MEIDKELERQVLLAPVWNQKDDQHPDIILLITSDTLGKESPELGKRLMYSFLYSLTEMPPRVRSIILINSAVKLALKKSKVLEPLLLLYENKVGILICEESVHYYSSVGEVAAGRTVNMYTIANILISSSHVLSI